jgi:arginyl-tRNA synthetase
VTGPERFLAKSPGMCGIRCRFHQRGAALIDPEDIRLIKAISRYPDVVKQSAQSSEPHRITYFLMNLSAAFHAYYNRNRVLGDDPLLSWARLYLISAVKKTIRNGLKLLGVSAPEKM